MEQPKKENLKNRICKSCKKEFSPVFATDRKCSSCKYPGFVKGKAYVK